MQWEVFFKVQVCSTADKRGSKILYTPTVPFSQFLFKKQTRPMKPMSEKKILG